ncbi:MAG: phospholipid/cholesterol/gamma-HCH transport system substrate-binding protein [Thermoleophilaceae bacterium]|nr:phospholipid/cholesterol/gamma-HCH transport system substrate-binding protein [Thermoleophilaceae bacterium]
MRGRGAQRGGMSPFSAGLLAIVVVAVATYFAFSQANPFSKPYHITAYFNNANNLQSNSPVRIAGVEVGTVTDVSPADPKTGEAKVKMEIEDKGLPLHKDAQVKIRPRIFLEGNEFVDMQPGSPEAPVLKSGGSIPATQTSAPVQFEAVLRTLQRDTRTDLQTLLQEFSKGLGGGGAEAFNRSIKFWKPAYQYSSLANDATLGTEPHDLSKLVRAQGQVFHSLSSDETALADLVTNLNTTFAAFASQDQNLRAAIPALDNVLKVGNPALASLNNALPSLRQFSRDALPATRSSLPTINASMPFVVQARGLVQKSELRGLAQDLRPTIPALAKLNANSVPFLQQGRALSACTSNVLVPFATKPIPDPVFNIPDSSFIHDSNHGFVGLAGESRVNDANTPLFHVQQGGGPFSVVQNNADLGKTVSFGGLNFKPEGTMPAKPDHRSVFRPNLPCEKQEVADLNAPTGAADTLANPQPQPTAADKLREAAAQVDMKQFMSNLTLSLQGKDAPNPLQKVNENFSRLGREAADKLLTVPMEAAAVKQYGDKAQVPARFKKKYGVGK